MNGIARSMSDPAVAGNIETFETPTDDAWARDSGPTFLVDGHGDLGAVHWRFNAWGKGAYLEHGNDASIGEVMARASGARVCILRIVPRVARAPRLT